ncbi:MAG: hypothetical protein JJU15_04840 [Pararhodobacter sp.]|nr:hypothetical protein [Pararhodobacter sp.]
MTEKLLDAPAAPATKWSLFASGGEDSLRAIEALASGAVPGVSVQRHDSLETTFSSDPSAPVIILMSMPQDHMRAMLDAGSAPDTALQNWTKHASAILQRCRKNRRRVVLVDAAMLRTLPAAIAEALSGRLGLRFDTVPDAAPAEKKEFDDIHTAITEAMLISDLKARDLAEELEAMMLGPVSAPGDPVKAGVNGAQKLRSLATERDLLREALRQHLEELDTMRAALTKTEGAAKAQSTELQKKLSTAESDLASTTQERDLLREELRQMQDSVQTLLAENAKVADRHLLKAQCEALERRLDDAAERQRLRDSVQGAEMLKLAMLLQAERGQTNADLQNARDEIQRLLASTSWRVTRPIRVMKRGLSRS